MDLCSLQPFPWLPCVLLQSRRLTASLVWWKQVCSMMTALFHTYLVLLIGLVHCSRHSSVTTKIDAYALYLLERGSLCQLMFLLSYSVPVLDLLSNTLKCSIPRPKTRLLQFSPQGTYLTLWEPYAGICPAAVSLSHCCIMQIFGALVLWYSL